MYRELSKLGVRVPNGFGIHIDCFRDSISKEDLVKLHNLLDPLDKSSPRL